jgi:hypothetical protein
MADVKPDVKKDAPKTPSGPVVWEEVLLLILGIIALLFVFIPRFFHTDNISDPNQIQSQSTNASFDLKKTYDRIFSEQDQVIKNNRGEVVEVVKTPSLIDEGKYRLGDFINTASLVFFSFIIFLILLFAAIIYYNKFKTELIVNNYKKKFYPEDKNLDEKNEKILEKAEPDNNGIINPRWQVVGRYYNSANQSDWKLAILEADIMLYEVLTKSGFKGFSIGEILKFTDKSRLATLDQAWAAHKVRNEIAHQGLDYVLTRTKVEEAIANYEKVFEELNFI